MCVRARSKSPTPRGPGAPPRGQQTAAASVVSSWSPVLPFALFKVPQGICLWSEPEGRLGTTESPPPPPLFTDEKTNPADPGKSLKSRRPVLLPPHHSCLPSAFQQRPASPAVGGNGGNKRHLVG